MRLFSTILTFVNHKNPSLNKQKNYVDPCAPDSVFNSISPEMILYIFSFLSHSDICTLAKVSKQFCQIAYDRTLWRSFMISSHVKKRNIKKTIAMLSGSGRLQSVQKLSLRNKYINDDTMEYIVRNAPNLKDILTFVTIACRTLPTT
jgi:F-box-like